MLHAGLQTWMEDGSCTVGFVNCSYVNLLFLFSVTTFFQFCAEVFGVFFKGPGFPQKLAFKKKNRILNKKHSVIFIPVVMELKNEKHPSIPSAILFKHGSSLKKHLL